MVIREVHNLEKKKMGRPKVEQPKIVRLQVRFSQAEVEIIQKYATEHNLTITQLIRQSIGNFIDAEM
jgi:hypothetical protein